MMKMITRFIESSKGLIDLGINLEAITALPVMRRLMRMGEEIGEEELDKFDALYSELEVVFDGLRKDAKHEAVSDES